MEDGPFYDPFYRNRSYEVKRDMRLFRVALTYKAPQQVSWNPFRIHPAWWATRKQTDSEQVILLSMHEQMAPKTEQKALKQENRAEGSTQRSNLKQLLLKQLKQSAVVPAGTRLLFQQLQSCCSNSSRSQTIAVVPAAEEDSFIEKCTYRDFMQKM